MNNGRPCLYTQQKGQRRLIETLIKKTHQLVITHYQKFIEKTAGRKGLTHKWTLNISPTTKASSTARGIRHDCCDIDKSIFNSSPSQMSVASSPIRLPAELRITNLLITLVIAIFQRSTTKKSVGRAWNVVDDSWHSDALQRRPKVISVE